MGNPDHTGMLYIVGTPIGNLEDLTFRALRILKEVDVVAAEDTRHSQHLLTHYGVSTPLTSYHDFNKEEKTPVLLRRLQEGQRVALICDAGTPVISDPGYYLITRALEAQIPVVPIPGPSAILTALSGSGLPSDTFIFQGFLPRKHGARRRFLEGFQDEPRTLIFFEAPHRLLRTLEDLQVTLGDRRIVIGRELTKHHEEWLRGPVSDVAQALAVRRIRGEITVIVEGNRVKRKKRGVEDREAPPRITNGPPPS